MKASPALAMHASRALALRTSRQLFMRATPAHKMPQDMPPTGGYDPVQYKRNLPAVGFQPMYYLFAVGIVSALGFWRYKIGIDEWNELGREKVWSRIYITPLLQAEEDRDQVRRMYADKQRERDLLGHEAKVYHSDRFVRPTFQIVPPIIKD